MRLAVDSFAKRRKEKHLLLKTCRTNEMRVDFRRNKISPLSISSFQGTYVEVVWYYMSFWGRTSMISWTEGTLEEVVLCNGHDRLFF